MDETKLELDARSSFEVAFWLFLEFLDARRVGKERAVVFRANSLW